MPDTIDMIYDSVIRMENRQDKMMSCLTTEKIKVVKIEKDVENIKGGIEKHIKDKTVHFNQAIADETLGHRLKRKSPEIVAGGSFASFVAYLVIRIVENWPK